jgi:hypothetical protein
LSAGYGFTPLFLRQGASYVEAVLFLTLIKKLLRPNFSVVMLAPSFHLPPPCIPGIGTWSSPYPRL